MIRIYINWRAHAIRQLGLHEAPKNGRLDLHETSIGFYEMMGYRKKSYKPQNVLLFSRLWFKKKIDFLRQW